MFATLFLEAPSEVRLACLKYREIFYARVSIRVCLERF